MLMEETSEDHSAPIAGYLMEPVLVRAPAPCWRLKIRLGNRGCFGRRRWSSQDVAGKPGNCVIPCRHCLRFVVALAGIVVEGMLRIRLDLDFEGDSCLGERGFELVAAFVREVRGIGGVDAEDSSFDA